MDKKTSAVKGATQVEVSVVVRVKQDAAKYVRELAAKTGQDMSVVASILILQAAHSVLNKQATSVQNWIDAHVKLHSENEAQAKRIADAKKAAEAAQLALGTPSVKP